MLAAALRAKGWSNRDAGRAVLVGWKQRETLAKYPKPEAIAVKVGLLANGEATWWLNHEKALAALADLLHCKADELLPSGTERRPPLIEFVEFAELGGLLPGQDPCPVSPNGWLGAYVEGALQRGGRWWFVVPPGAGKSLAVRVLRPRHGAKAIVTTTRTLSEAAREARDGVPLVVEVDYADSAGESAAISEIAHRSDATCILAAFERPGSAANDGWNTCNFELHRNWRELLVGWTRSRLPVPERLNVEAILDWLDAVDPTGNVFSTPGDLISILARIYRAGIPKRSAGLVGLASEWLSHALGRESDPWVRRLGRDAVEHVVEARLRRIDLAFEPLSASTWATLLPASVLRPSNSPSPPSERGKRAKPRSEIEQATVSSNAREAVHALADKDVLRASHNGGLDVFPNWVRAGIEREVIQREVRSGNTGAWGLWAIDATRKSAIDDALDSLGPNELVRAAGRLCDDDDLASVAAVEALFSAFGRRFAVSDWRPSQEATATLQKLGFRQQRLLDLNPQFAAPIPFLPLTRHRPGFDRQWQGSWLIEAWNFSFGVTRPDDQIQDPGWQLPGWAADLRLVDAPSFPHLFPQSPDGDPWVKSLLLALRPVVRACRDAVLPKEVEMLLLPWVVIDGPARGWILAKSHARYLLGPFVLPLVSELLRREPEEVCVAAVTGVWLALLQVDGYQNPLYLLRFLRDQNASFLEHVAKYLPLDVFEGVFANVDVANSGDELGSLTLGLPDRLRRVVLLIVARQNRATGRPIWNLDADVVRALGSDEIELLVELGSERYSVGGAATERVWSLDPVRALDEARNAVADETEYASNWFHSAPRAQLPLLLDALEERGQRLSWTTRWLATVLSRAGEHAVRVFSLMRQQA